MEPRRSHRTVVILVVAALAGAGCSNRALSTRAKAPDDLGLGSLLESHGGATAWSRHAAVRFRYRMRPRGRDDFLEIPAVAFRLSDYRHVWLQAREDGSWVRVSLERSTGFIDPELGRFVAELDADWTGELAAVDFALRSVRHLFQPVLAATAGAWSVRRLIAPPGIRAPTRIEVVPRTSTSPHSVCLLVEDPSTGLLAATVSATSHPFVGERAVRTSYTGYEEIGGVRVSMRRRNEIEQDRPEDVPDPFAEISGPPPPPPILEEEIRSVRFLDASFARTHLELPEESPGASPAGDDETRDNGPTVD